MIRSRTVLTLSLVAGLLMPAAAWADAMNFKLAKNYSRATFKSDAPLETDLVFVRN